MKSIQQDLFADKSPASLSERTCQVSSMSKTTLSAAFWGDCQVRGVNSSRQGSDGQTLVVCLDHLDRSIGESLMLNISDSPNAVSACLLSQVLEQKVSEKYFLSEKACTGILRRAAAKGKVLPPIVQFTLQEQARLLAAKPTLHPF